MWIWWNVRQLRSWQSDRYRTAMDRLSRQPRAVGPLIRLLRSAEVLVDSRVAEVLGSIGESAVDALVRELQHQLPRVRALAAEALAQTASSRAAEPLIEASRDPAPEVRHAAARGLGRFASVAIPRLLELAGDEDPGVRSVAANGLARSGDACAIERLAAMLGDESQKVAEDARHALATMDDPAAKEALAANPGLLRFQPRCPLCAGSLGVIEVPRGGGLVGRELICNGCRFRVAWHVSDERLVARMVTLPREQEDPGEVEWDPFDSRRQEAIDLCCFLDREYADRILLSLEHLAGLRNRHAVADAVAMGEQLMAREGWEAVQRVLALVVYGAEKLVEHVGGRGLPPGVRELGLIWDRFRDKRIG